MEEKKILCSLVTPMYSHGADQNEVEFRTPELKGAMRYAYRIACPAELQILKKDEAELFGGAAGSNNSDGGHASPIRLSIHSDIKSVDRKLLFHKGNNIKNIKKCFPAGGFEITVRFNDFIKMNLPGCACIVDIDWYIDLIKLSLMLCGMGLRSRKGKGCVKVDDPVFETEHEMMEWLCTVLNKIAAASSQSISGAFEMREGEIVSKYSNQSLKRPVIQKIRIGKMMKWEQNGDYLWALDKSCHDMKYNKKISSIQKQSTGNLSPRFASPLFIRLIQTKIGCFPIYLFVNGILEKAIVDQNCAYREAFIQMLEANMEGGVRR